MHIILLGPPGAGKGTQAELLKERLGIAHVASGDLFRANIAQGTSLGCLAKGYLDRGELVPDDLTIKMVMERLAQPDTAKGVVLDGFPRTQEQAAALEVALRAQGKQIDAAVYLKIREEVLVARLSARWICPVEGATYNLVTNPPRVVGRCDLDGTELYQREDDKPETVRRRLQVYENQTAPLLDYYRRGGVLKQVDGETSLEEVHRAILQVLGGG